MKENLMAKEVGGVLLDNVVFINEPFEVTSSVNFNTASDIKGPLHVEGLVNGINIDENLKDTIALTGNKKFKHIIINGNLDWEMDREELEKLSYFFENAVRKSESQTILGKVTFLKGLESENLLLPDVWLEGVNMQNIWDDALMKDSTTWDVSGNNRFLRPLRIMNIAQPITVLDTDSVNGINLIEMYEDVYKSIDKPGRVIQGNKELNGRVIVDNLDVQNEILEIGLFELLDNLANHRVSDLVIEDDAREISQVHFNDLTIIQNLEWPTGTSSGINLNSLITDRVSLTAPHQVLEGVYTFPSVSVIQSCRVSVINDINVKNTINRDAFNIPSITGNKIFSKGLKIEGEVEVSSLNNHPMQELLQQTLRLDQQEVINRPVIFEKAVTVNQPVEMESVNDIQLKSFSKDVSARIGRLVSEAESPEHIAMELQSRESILQRMALERPSWLEYLRLKQDLTVLGAKSKVDHIRTDEMGDTLVMFHHSSSLGVEASGLPQGCSCNKVDTLRIQEGKIERGQQAPSVVAGVDNCLQVYHVASQTSETTYSITSEVFATNVSCISEEDKTTKIFAGQELLGEMKLGHVSDAGVFSDNEKDFLILAQYFDTDTKSHSTTTKVMHVGQNGILKTVQSIGTHGAKKVALGQVNNVWMLAIANSKESVEDKECNADSAIYVWSSKDEQFLLLRTVMTDGVFDVAFITTESGNEFYKQSFVAFAQEGNSASGEVLIFRFEQLGGNFVLSQTIRSKWPITSLGTTCFCRQCFLTTVVPQEGITFFENRFVEGFQEYYKAPVFGSTDISSFTLNADHLLAIATEKGPILAEAVMAGQSC